MQLDQKRTQTIKESDRKIAEKAATALAYLKRTNNLDTAEALGLSPYLEEDADAQEHEDRGVGGGD